MGQFEQDTAVVKVDDGLYRGEVHEGWRVGEVPNGGYVLGIAGRVLRAALPHKDPLTVNAFFLSPTTLGPVDCRIDILRVGGSTSFAEVGMFQGDQLKVKVTAAYTDLENLQGESWTNVTRPEFPPWEACEPSPQKGIELRQRVELRLVSGKEVFTRREPDGSGVFDGWMQHRDATPPDVISLLMFADALPPPVFSVVGPVGWVPTIELTVQLRAHPSPGPLQARLVTRHVSAGVLEEDGQYWDASGTLVALSRQTAKLRIPKPR